MKKLFYLTGVLTLTCLITAFTFNYEKKIELLPEAYKLIPAGTVEINGVKEQVEEFYMFNTEISNQDYRNIMTYCKQWDPEKFVPMFPDTMVWNQMAEQANVVHPYIGKYFMHADYALYPVVGIMPSQAMLYCKVIENIFNERLAQIGRKVKVTLPTHAQFLRAAEGDHPEWNYSFGNKIKNSKGKKLANYREVPEEWLGYGEQTVDQGMKVYAGEEWLLKHNKPQEPQDYEPNAFGLYNLNGNVAELLRDGMHAAGGHFDNAAYDVRNRSVVEVDRVSPTLGFRVVVEFQN